MKVEISAKLFKNGGSRAVRIPASWSFEGDEVTMTFDPTTKSIVIRNRQHAWLDDFYKLQDELMPEIGTDWTIERDQGTDDFKSPFETWVD